MDFFYNAFYIVFSFLLGKFNVSEVSNFVVSFRRWLVESRGLWLHCIIPSQVVLRRMEITLKYQRWGGTVFSNERTGSENTQHHWCIWLTEPILIQHLPNLLSNDLNRYIFFNIKRGLFFFKHRSLYYLWYSECQTAILLCC